MGGGSEREVLSAKAHDSGPVLLKRMHHIRLEFEELRSVQTSADVETWIDLPKFDSWYTF